MQRLTDVQQTILVVEAWRDGDWTAWENDMSEEQDETLPTEA